MPKAKSESQTSEMVAPAPEAVVPTTSNGPPAHPADGRPIKYPRVDIKEYSTASEKGPVTPQLMKNLMNWETEPQFQERMMRENPGTKASDWTFGEVFHCINGAKEKVRCWFNSNNRPFDMGWCEELIDMILKGQWAGPHTIPGETINGETIRISRYGMVESGQHQGTAVILADEELQRARKRANYYDDPDYPFWNGHEHPFIETIIITGLSEDERVLRTVDYVKPRTTADMLYTMPLYKHTTMPNGEVRQTTPTERKELTRMLAGAIDFLWDRTDTKGYKTHPEVVGFLERHMTLLECVQHLFKVNTAQAEDGGRKISKLHISAGMASALCYLMGSSGPGTDGDVYRNQSPPSEKGLDWSYMDRARAFWALLANDRTFIPVRTKLNNLTSSDVYTEENYGLGGRANEKLAVLSKAWDHWKEWEGNDPPFSMDDLGPDGLLELSYSSLDDQGKPLPEGKIKLIDDNNFGGIDCTDKGVGGKGVPSTGAPMPPPPTPEEIERAKEEALRRRAEEEAKKVDRRRTQ